MSHAGRCLLAVYPLFSAIYCCTGKKHKDKGLAMRCMTIQCGTAAKEDDPLNILRPLLLIGHRSKIILCKYAAMNLRVMLESVACLHLLGEGDARGAGVDGVPKRHGGN